MTPKLKPLADQVMLVTGASSGIGLVTARAAAERGARLMLVARDAEALARAADEIRAAGGEAEFAVADVGDLPAVRRAAKVAVERFGRIDSWVNNAGVAIYAKLADTPMAEHEQLFRTNYFGGVHGALTAVEHLRRDGGALITVVSIAADIPSPVMGAYSASKHALKAYVEALRIEVEADALPISVTLIKPSGIDTPIAEHAANHVDGKALIPPPVYDPKLVADAILDAAEHPRREVTIGGVGRAQVLAVTHAPRLLDWFGGWMETLLSDPARPKIPGDNLARTAGNNRERSRGQSGRRLSLYAAVGRHGGLLAGAAALAGAALLLPAARKALARR